jgi:hypothetical protein
MHDRTKRLMQNANAKELVKKGLEMFEKVFRCCSFIKRPKTC